MPDTKFTHPRKKLSYKEAIAYTERWLEENYLTPEARAEGTVCSIEDYLDGDEAALKQRPWLGVRVSEVDFHIPKVGGGSYMQVEMPWGIAVCGEVERCIIALIEGWNAGDEDETDMEFERLADLLDRLKEDD